jgi:hypothetical protein
MKVIRGGKDDGKNKNQPPEASGAVVKKMTDTKTATDVLYAQVLLQFVQPFMAAVPDIEELEEKLNIGLMAWNLAVIKQNDKDFYKEYSKSFLTEIKPDIQSKQLLDKLLTIKETEYDEYNVILIDCEIVPNKKGEARVEVNSKTYEQFIQDLLLQNMDAMDDDDEDESNSGSLNRTAVAVIPKQPFLDWLEKTFFPDKLPQVLLEENTMYLLDAIDDKKGVERWLKKNFDQIFSNELNEWTDDKKDWPKNRTYKMFAEWFDVKICSMIYDLGSSPLLRD